MGNLVGSYRFPVEESVQIERVQTPHGPVWRVCGLGYCTQHGQLWQAEIFWEIMRAAKGLPPEKPPVKA